MKAIQKRRQMTGQGGFTLIELLVVIAILGVLAAVVVFAVGGINDTSKESACKIDARTLKTSVQAYFAQEKTWPADQATLQAEGFLDAPSELYDFTVNASTGVVTTTAIVGNPNNCT